nr:MAG TPA: hypothetical protein [Bacteriophage sp.]
MLFPPPVYSVPELDGLLVELLLLSGAVADGRSSFLLASSSIVCAVSLAKSRNASIYSYTESARSRYC